MASSAALLYLNNDTEQNTEYLARKIIVNTKAGNDVTILINSLIARQNPDGGFGDQADYASNVLDTAFVLEALSLSGQTSSSVISAAIQYLQNEQQTDGGYIVSGTNLSSVYLASLVSSSLQRFFFNYNVGITISAANQYLLAAKSINNSWSSDWETAIALLALVPATSDSNLYTNAVSDLRASQLTDGSWLGDVYSTALAIRALYLVDNLQRPVDPGLGTVIGQVIDAQSGLPVQSVTVSLSPSGPTALTSGDGSFKISSINPGLYSLNTSSAGYQASSQTISFNKNTFIDTGAILISRATNTGLVTGTITDVSTGLPISNAQIQIIGASSANLFSDSAGQYSATVIPGSLTISISATGFNSASTTTSIAAGVLVTYSPALLPIGVPPTDPVNVSIKGKVFDSQTGAALPGVVIAHPTTGANTTSQADGTFVLTGIPAGDVALQFSAMGYGPATLTSSATAGTTLDFGVIYLSPFTAISGTSVISGIVTDTDTGRPIAGATVTADATLQNARGNGVLTDASGYYRIENIPGAVFDVVANMPGYRSFRQRINQPAPGTVGLPITLSRATTSGFDISSLKAPAASYPSNTNIPLAIELQNSGAVQQSVFLYVKAINDSNQIVERFPVVRSGTASDFIDVGPSAQVQTTASWQTGSNTAGVYSVVVEAYSDKGELLAERALPITVQLTQKVGGAVTFDPPIAQLASNKPISITAAVDNRGNVPIAETTVTATVRLKNKGKVPPVAEGDIISLASAVQGLNGPVDTTIDSAGNIYIANTYDQNILKVALDGTTTEFASGIPNQINIGIDANNTVYVLTTSRIYVQPQSGAASIIIPALANMKLLHVLPNGKIFVVTLSNDLYEVFSDGSSVLRFSKGLSSPKGVAGDVNGNFYIADSALNRIVIVNSGGTLSDYVTGIPSPYGIDIDAVGNLYVTSFSTGILYKVGLDKSVTQITSGLFGPYDVKISPTGGFVVSNNNTNEIISISATGQKTILARETIAVPTAAAIDINDNVVVANSKTFNLVRLAPDNSAETIVSGTATVYAMAITSGGDIYTNEAGQIRITRPDGTRTNLLNGIGALDRITATNDGAGVYLTRQASHSLWRVNADGSSSEIMAPQFTRPRTFRTDSSGNKFILSSDGYITRIDNMGVVSRITSGLQSPNDIAVANSGLIFVTEALSRRVVQVNADGSQTEIAILPFTPAAIEVRSDGSLLVSDGATNDIYSVDPATGISSLFVTAAYKTPYDIYEDSTGVLWLAHSFNSRITRIALDGTQTQFVVSGQPRAVTGDGSGGVYVVSRSRITQINNVGSVSDVIVGGLIGFRVNVGISLDTDGSFWLLDNGATFSQLSADLLSIEKFSSLSRPGPITITANGALVLINSGNSSLLRIDDPTKLPRVIGASVHTGIVSEGPNTILTYSSVSMQRIDITNGVVLATMNNIGSSIGGIARASDGTITVVERTSRLKRLTSAGVISDEFIGLVKPKGLAFNLIGELLVANSSPDGIAIVRPDGTLRRFSQEPGANYIQYNSDGTLFTASQSRGLVQIDQNGNRIKSFSTIFPMGITRGSDGLLYVTTVRNGSALLQIQPDFSFNFLALGLGIILDFDSDSAGNLYFADKLNGAISVVAPDFSLSVLNTDVKYADQIAIAPDDTLFIAYQSSVNTRVFASFDLINGFRKLSLGTISTNDNLKGLSAPDSNSLIGLHARNKSLFKYVIRAPVQPIQQGAVVYTATRVLPASSSGTAALNLDFGSWLPEVAGDFEVTLSVADGVTQSALVNTLHVGPQADGQFALDQVTVPPGNTTVSASLTITGADSTRISSINTSGVSLAAKTGIVTAGGYIGLVSDDTGNLFVWGAGRMDKITLDGVQSTIATGLGRGGAMEIDDLNNLYVFNGSMVQKVTPAGVVSDFADVGGTINGMVMGKDGSLYTMANFGRITRITKAGVTSIVSTLPLDFVRGITTNVTGNLYTSHRNGLGFVPTPFIKIDPVTGQSSTLFENVTMELEGVPYTGDCANNLLFAPFKFAPYKPDRLEEYLLMQYVGNTGEFQVVFDGRTIDPALSDMDVLKYDRKNQRLLIWTDVNRGKVFSFPLNCGGIDAETHIVTRADVDLSSTSPAPDSIVNNGNGTKEYIWSLANVDTKGFNIQLNMLFNNMTEGETRDVFADAFLVFNNSFAPGETVRVPITIPQVQASSGMAIVSSITGSPFAPNTNIPITVDVNNGGSAPFNGKVQLTIVDANGAQVTSLAPIDVTNLPASTSTILNATLNTGNTIAGGYQVNTTLLDNNGNTVATGNASFTINAGVIDNPGAALYSLRSYADKQTYHTTDQVIISSLVQNLSANIIVSGATLEVIVANSGGTAIFTSTLPLISDFVPGATRNLSATVSLVNNSEGAYQVNSRLLSGAGLVLATSTTSFNVVSSLTQALSADVSVATRILTGGNTQTCTATLTNNGVNAIAALNAHFLLTDVTAGTLVTDEITAISLAVGGQTTLTRTIDTTGVPEHDYACVIQINVNGVNETLGYAAYTVIPAALAEVALALDRPVYHTTDTVNITQTINNITVSTPVAGATLQTEVRDSTNQVVFTFNSVLATFNAGTSLTVVVPYTYIYNAPGSYRAIARVMSNTGVELAASEQAFTIRNMIAEVLTTSLALSAPQVQVGTAQSCIATLTNTGYFDITNLDVLHRIVNATGAIITSNPYQISLTQNQGTTLSLNQATNNLALGAYQCRVLANIAGTLTPLASAGFAVIPPPISLDGELKVGDRGRLLILLDDEEDDSSSSSHNTNGGPTLAAQRAFIEQLLTDNGWSFTITNDPAVFETEFHSGGYQVYLLLGEDGKLPEQTQTALREAVFRGEGLIVAGNHDNRDTKNKKLNDALGIKLSGKITDATGVTVNAGPLATNGSSLTLMTSEKVIRIKLQGATAQALYLPSTAGQSDDCDDDSSSSSSSIRTSSSSSSDSSDTETCLQALTAITSHDYGRGRGVYAGFDLLANATLNGNTSVAAQLILDALDYTHPALIEETAGGGLPIQLTASNRGVAADVRASITLPPAVTVIDAADATQTTNPAGYGVLKWNLLLQANMQATWQAWIQLPEIVGPISLNATVEGAVPNSGIYQLQAQPTLDINVLATPTTTDVDGLLANLETNGIGDSNRIKQARKSLAKASQNLPDDPAKAFSAGLKAADSLSKAGSHPDINAARIMLGQWLWELARQLPASSGGSS